MVVLLTLWAIVSAILIFNLFGKLARQQKELESFKSEAGDAYRRVRGWVAELKEPGGIDAKRPSSPELAPAPVAPPPAPEPVRPPAPIISTPIPAPPALRPRPDVQTPPPVAPPAPVPTSPAPQPPAAKPPQPMVPPPAPLAAASRPQFKAVVPEQGFGAARGFSIDKFFAGNWLVWIGGIALALGGGFLVKYASDAGVFGPEVRLIGAGLLAFALIVGGEFLRRRPLAKAFGPVGADLAPAILTAAGLFIAYADIYAAHAIYPLLGSTAAFILLALTSFAALGFSLLHGRPIGLLGLLGAHLVPLLVQSAAPQLLPLFVFLGVVTITSVGIFRRQGWWGMTLVALAGNVMWTLVGILQSAATLRNLPDTQMILGVFMLVTAVVIGTRWQPGLPFILPDKGKDATTPHTGALPRDMIDGIALMAGIFICGLMFTAVLLSAYRVPMIWLGGILLALLFARAATRRGLDLLAVVTAGALFLALLIWTIGRTSGWRVENQIWFYVWACGLGGGSVLMIQLAPKRGVPALWAITAVASLVCGYLLGFGFLGDAQRSGQWGLIGAGTALVPFAGLAQLRHSRSRLSLQSIYAWGFFILVTLALAATFSQNHLTLALAATVLLAALSYRSLRLPSLQWIAGALALLVLARLAFNPDLFTLVVTPPVWNWLLPVYGGAAGVFFVSQRIFRQADAKPMLLNLLEATSIGLAVMLVSLNIRSFIAQDSKLTGEYGFVEQSMQSIAWLGFSLGLGAVRRQNVSIIIKAARWILFAMALGNILLFQLISASPLITSLDIGKLPIANALALGLLVPGVMLLVMMLFGERREEKLYPAIAGGAGLSLCLVWSALELRHAFQGPVITLSRATTAMELYSYPILFLLWGVALYLVPPVQKRTHLRLIQIFIFMLGCLMFAVSTCFINLPLFHSLMTGAWPLINLIGFGFLLPGLLLLGFMYLAEKRNDRDLAQGAGILGVLALIVWSVLELRHAFMGQILNASLGWQAAEAYSYPLLLLGWSFVLRQVPWTKNRPGLRHVGTAAFFAGIGWVVLGNMLTLSPLLNSWSMGALPGANLLALAYLVPAGVIAWLGTREKPEMPALLLKVLWALSGLLVFVWCNLTLRHVFQGPVLSLTRPYTSSEYYGYSLLWLVMSALLFFAAVRTRHKWLEYAFMGLTLLTIAKVFLFDMSALSGVLRAVSFMGLGAALVGLGLLYRRFLHRQVANSGHPQSRDDGTQNVPFAASMGTATNLPPD
jgi:uncharacterized membrane protein